MQVAQPCGGGGFAPAGSHVCCMGDLTSLIKAQLLMNSHLFVFNGSFQNVNVRKSTFILFLESEHQFNDAYHIQ